MKLHLRVVQYFPVLLLVATCPLLAQAPLLAVSAPTPRVVHLPSGIIGHSWTVLLTNNYTAPVTAYEITFQNGASGGGLGDDSIPGMEGLRPQLPPGASASRVVPGNSTTTTPLAIEVVGVIYADGATAGDPAVIQHFLHVRAVFVAELPQTIARLRAISADPGADQALVMAHFQQQADIESGLLRDGNKAHVPPRIAGSVVESLTVNSGESLQSAAAHFAHIFAEWTMQLNASKPKLPAIAFPLVR